MPLDENKIAETTSFGMRNNSIFSPITEIDDRAEENMIESISFGAGKAPQFL